MSLFMVYVVLALMIRMQHACSEFFCFHALDTVNVSIVSLINESCFSELLAAMYKTWHLPPLCVLKPLHPNKSNMPDLRHILLQRQKEIHQDRRDRLRQLQASPAPEELSVQLETITGKESLFLLTHWSFDILLPFQGLMNRP